MQTNGLLSGQVALVTGASRGIGRAIALTLAKAGAKVVVNYQGNEKAAGEVLDMIRSGGGEASLCRADVAQSADVESMFKEIVEVHGGVDILVNNAGITRDKLIMRMKDEEWEQVLNINLTGVFNCIRGASRLMMKQRRGKIVNVSSVIGLTGNIGQINYAAAKAGVIGITKSAAKELAARGITVNAVAPGFIETEMTAALDEKTQESYISGIPLGRLGNPKDVANLVLFLASPYADYITGQVIRVDGGLLM